MKCGGWVALSLCLAIAAVVAGAGWRPGPWSAPLIGLVVGAAIGFLEVLETFPTHAGSAFRTGWGFVLVVANAMMSLLAVALALAIYQPAYPLLVAVAISLALPVVIRTRFTLLKASPTIGDDVVLDLGQAYDRIHRVCFQQADQELVACWEEDIERIVVRFSTTQSMLRLFSLRVDCLSRLSQDDREIAKKAAAAVAEESSDEATRLVSLARLVVEHTGTIDPASLNRLAQLLRPGPDDRSLTDLAASELRQRIARYPLSPELAVALDQVPADDTPATRQLLAAYLGTLQDP
ncbi:MAG: hypothetical protein IT204_21510 [Fimbriimonadaceae bacterium]|nr:hypothetical protein [Fimbriimonadaceae bacterium]